jgi:hypothetical protein
MSSNSSASGVNSFGVNDTGIRRPLDPNAEPDASEFSWGAGLEPQSVQGRPPPEGGRYKGKAPQCPPIIGVGRA